MDYVKPTAVVATMVDTSASKLALPARDLIIRGAMAGALLGTATSLAFTAVLSTGQPLVGAVIFPIGLVMIVLLGLELLTGSFALLPLSSFENRTTAERILQNFGWVFLGNLIGSVVYGGMLAIVLTNMGTTEPSGIAARIIATAEAKTIGYSALGLAGLVTAFVKSILCNWLVCLGVVLAMTTSSTLGKICAAWLPIFVFFAQGFEHAVVNMFVIPTGIVLGARVTLADWWLWNQIPVTLGNFLGGFIFTGFALYVTHRPQPAAALPAIVNAPAE